MSEVVVFLTAGTTSWVVPSGVTSAKVECIGEGGLGNGYDAGRGGDYARVDNLALTPGVEMACQIGFGGQGDLLGGVSTWFGSPTTVCGNSGDGSDLNYGDVLFNGGEGGLTVTSKKGSTTYGGGGGAAGGPDGYGDAGETGDVALGAGHGGNTASGSDGGTADGGNGSTSVIWTQTSDSTEAGPGGGGGGNTGDTTIFGDIFFGGNGGSYGGGAGAGPSGSGTPAPGIIVITYNEVTGGKIKVWNGTSWVEKPVKVWNGTSWVLT